MRKIKHKFCLLGILIFFVVGNVYLSNSMSKQAKAIEAISSKNKELIQKVKDDEAIANSIAEKIQKKQDEILSILKTSDIQTLNEQATAIKEELTKISTDFSNYKTLYDQSKITQAQLEQGLKDTQAKLTELDAKFSVLQTAISTLDGSLQDRIRTELGDIDALKEQIKQEIILELSQ